MEKQLSMPQVVIGADHERISEKWHNFSTLQPNPFTQQKHELVMIEFRKCRLMLRYITLQNHDN